MAFQDRNNYVYSDDDFSCENTDFSESSVYTLSDSSSNKKSPKFTPDEDDTLSYYVSIYGQKQWKLISQQLPGKTPMQCMQRYNKIAKNSSIKGSWTKEEDQKLYNWVSTHGATKWAQASKIISGRTGKQIRERWFNHLNPDVKRGCWNEEEDEQIFELYQKFGTSWSKIAKYMPGRPENSIKNRFYSTLRKLVSDLKKSKSDCGTKLETIIEASADSESYFMNHLYRVVLPCICLASSPAASNAEVQPIKVGSSNILILPSKVSMKKEKQEPEFIAYETKEKLIHARFDNIEEFDDDCEMFFENAKKMKINTEVNNQLSFDDFVDKVFASEQTADELNVNTNNHVQTPQNQESGFVFSPLIKEKAFDFAVNENVRLFSDDSLSSSESQNNLFFEFNENWNNNDDAYKLRFDLIL